MRKLALFLVLAGTAASAFAMKRVTVAQLEQEVTALQGKPDAKAARQLADLQLTERLSTARFTRLQAENLGPKVREALRIIADMSAFLNLPPAEVPQTPAPDLSTQLQILKQTINYVGRTVHQLPNFLATRVTTRFEGLPQELFQDDTNYPYQLLRFAGISSSLVSFRDGHEVVDVAGKSKNKEPAINPMTTRGVFGPILYTVMLDMTHGTVKWSHWEVILGKTLAVFAFSVPRKQSHFQIEAYRQPNDPSRAIQQPVGYHGQIAVDPENGTVFRIVVQADLKPTDSISRSDILVDYGPVELGGRSYICPTRSVAILMDNTMPTSTAQSFSSFSGVPIKLKPHTLIQLNDVAFTQYHVFRAKSRIMP